MCTAQACTGLSAVLSGAETISCSAPSAANHPSLQAKLPGHHGHVKGHRLLQGRHGLGGRACWHGACLHVLISCFPVSCFSCGSRAGAKAGPCGRIRQRQPAQQQGTFAAVDTRLPRQALCVGFAESVLLSRRLPHTTGWRTRNLRVMADRYAQRGTCRPAFHWALHMTMNAGFRVVLPDLFHDERVEPGWSPEQQAAFWERHPLPETVQLAEGVLAACKDLHAGLVGMQGFCWGAKLIVALAGARLVTEQL